MNAIPILLYHSVSRTASQKTARIAVTPDAFARHLDAVVEGGRTVLTVSEYARALEERCLPDRPLVITFDDGYADFYDQALPALEARGLRCTLYVTTGFLEGRPGLREERRPEDPFLDWGRLRELAARGVEIGGHSHSHLHLDTLTDALASHEITSCKALLEDELQTPVTTFAYPHGFSSASLRRLVVAAGYTSACGVRNAFSSADDDPFLLARLMLLDTTTERELRRWLEGVGARVAPRREFLRTRLFRRYRRTCTLVSGQPVSAFSGSAAASHEEPQRR